MTQMRSLLTTLVAGVATLAFAGAQQPPAQQPPAQPPAQQQPDIVELRITGVAGLPPKYAVPDFVALTSDAETRAAAATIGQVLWDDLNFEREFYLIPRDTYRSIPPAQSIDQFPLDRWRELQADAVVVGSVRKTGNGVAVQMRLIRVATGQSAMGKEYSGSIANPRLFAHTISDEIHKLQVGLDGVARTKLVFSSDRDGERMKGPVAERDIKNLYVSDYDGARQTRLTVVKSLDITPTWSPDRSTIAFTSYRTGFQDIYLMFPTTGKPIEKPARGTAERQNYLPAWSPDGTRIAFTSNRDGNPEIYVMNRDGGNVRRLTNSPAVDVTPTWSPAGTQIAFTSDRSGSPQIYVMNADGTGLKRITSESWCDRPTWSPAPFNEIAYASRSGGGFDIRIFDFAKGGSRNITDGIGSNESPAFAPNGKHLAFVSTRSGKEQIFTIARDGNDLRQITKIGSNRYPDWSK
jgi:TolB protein